MSHPAPDLSRLKIDRDQPSRGSLRALRFSVVLAVLAVAFAAAVWFVLRGRRAIDTLLSQVLGFIAVFIATIMAVGAVNTMYAAVAARAPEIGVLLTLGFKRRNVMASFLAEAALIALLGGLLGCLAALPINGLVTSTTNWSTFSEIAFAFRVTPWLLVSGIVFALVMGLVGGFFPAWRAARANVVDSLREA